MDSYVVFVLFNTDYYEFYDIYNPDPHLQGHIKSIKIGNWNTDIQNCVLNTGKEWRFNSRQNMTGITLRVAVVVINFCTCNL